MGGMTDRLTLDEVVERVTAIVTPPHDDEAKHSAEHALHQEVLLAIAQGHPDAQMLARAALETNDGDFARSCA